MCISKRFSPRDSCRKCINRELLFILPSDRLTKSFLAAFILLYLIHLPALEYMAGIIHFAPHASKILRHRRQPSLWMFIGTSVTSMNCFALCSWKLLNSIHMISKEIHSPIRCSHVNRMCAASCGVCGGRCHARRWANTKEVAVVRGLLLKV